MKVFKWLKNITRMKKITRKQLIRALFLLGEAGENIESKNWKNSYKKVISVIMKNKRRTITETYNMASVYKRLKDYSKSISYFKKVIKNTDHERLLANAYFHIGEIHVEKNKARDYFQKTLQLEPKHIKAAEYLINNK